MIKRSLRWTAFVCLALPCFSAYAHPIESEDFTTHMSPSAVVDVVPPETTQTSLPSRNTLPSDHEVSLEALNQLATESIRDQNVRVVSVDLTHASEDIWQRIRNGFGMQDLTTSLVMDQQAYYLANRNYTLRTLERARPYLHMIVEEIEKRGMPTEIALLPMVESAYNPTALSPANASGLWQFIPSTGKRYGLEQNWWVDQRRDVIDSTKAALEYLKYTYDMHGDWHLALASYNWGEGAVGRAVNKNIAKDLPTNYEYLTMPKETRHYVPKLQALKNIIAAPHLYGIQLPDIPNEPYLSTVHKEHSIDVKLAAQLADMPLKDFLALNPSFKRPIIPAYNGNARIVLPADRVPVFQENLVRHKAANLPLVSWTTYHVPTVAPLNNLAQSLGVSAEAIRSANGLTAKTRTIAAGTTILIPANEPSYDPVVHIASASERPSHVEYLAVNDPSSSVRMNRVNSSTSAVVRAHPDPNYSRPSEDTEPRIVRATMQNSPSPRILRTNAPLDSDGEVSLSIPVRQASIQSGPDITRQLTNPPIETPASKPTKQEKKPTVYVVKKGDTLASIAKKHQLTVAQLRSFNGLKTNATVKAGQRLSLVNKQTATKPSATQKTVTYQVKKGDTLSKIAARHNVTVAALRANNNLKSDSVKTGQILVITPKASQVKKTTSQKQGNNRKATTTTQKKEKKNTNTRVARK